MPEIVLDDLTKTPSITAADRAKRADQTGVVSGKKKEEKKEKKKKVDYFAKGNEHMTPPTVYQDKEDWTVRVFPNKYPILKNHEIIVHSPDEYEDLPNLPQDQVVRYLEAILNRIEHYLNEDKEVFIYNNRGPKAGASIHHPHSQLVAHKSFPGYIHEQREAALDYFDEHGTCYWCDLIKEESEEGSRVVYESAHFIILVPEAAKWSYEMKLLPKRHLPNMLYTNKEEIIDLARTLQAALHAYDELFDFPDRNYWIYTEKHEHYHWHMGFIPHIKVFGGLELGAGIWVSDKATSEDAAKYLGEAARNYLKT